MIFNKLVDDAKFYFPDLKIKYKSESLFMKILGKLLFFNKYFMTDYTTTIGNTIYFPSREYIEARPISGSIIFMHELTHIYDSSKYSILYNLLYLFPQIMALLSLIIMFFSWKLALIWGIFFLLPLPAYFRMQFEKRAYMVSLYVIKQLSIKLGFVPILKTHKDLFLKYFKDSSYYYMWTFKELDKDFEKATLEVSSGNKPYNGKIFNILDDLISKN